MRVRMGGEPAPAREVRHLRCRADSLETRYWNPGTALGLRAVWEEDRGELPPGFRSLLRQLGVGFLEFLLDPGDLVRLDLVLGQTAPLLQRGLPFLLRFPNPADLVVNVPQVVVDGRVVGNALQGPAEVLLGQVQAVLFEISPAEAVEIGAVVGVPLQGA